MFHKATNIEFIQNTILRAEFQDGCVKQYDVSSLFGKHGQLVALKDWDLFRTGRLVGGYGIIWTDDLDLDIETIYQEGTLVGKEEPSSVIAIGESVRGLRALRGISQKELARMTGIDQGDISKLERGRGNPSVKTLERIVRALDGRIEIVPSQD